MSLTKAQKLRQVKTASQLGAINQDSLKSAIQMVKTASGKISNLKNTSRVNEQELFGALIYEGLGNINKGAQKSFMESLGGFIGEVATFDQKNSVLRGVKRALKKLINGKELVKDAARLLRQFALGKSQLDGDAKRLSVNKKDIKGEGTPVRSLKNALDQVKENIKADAVQHFEFKQNNKAEFKNKGKKQKTEVEITSDTGAVAPPNDYKAEYEVRLANASQTKRLIEGPLKGYSEENRFDAVREFFESESQANDGTVTDRANEIVSMLLKNDTNVDGKMKKYMKDVFDIDVEYQNTTTSDLREPPGSIDGAEAKFKAEFKIRQEKANAIKVFMEGPVVGYSNEERGDKVLDFLKSEMKALDEKASKKANEIYSKFIKASGRDEAMVEVDSLIKKYMSDVFRIEIEYKL